MKTLTSLLLALLLAGCATRGSNYTPLVDMKHKSQTAFTQDTFECQAYAKQRADAAQGAVIGAVLGAILGAAIAPRGYRGNLAAHGAVAGGLGGGLGANENQETIVKRCLAGRGYSVLN